MEAKAQGCMEHKGSRRAVLLAPVATLVLLALSMGGPLIQNRPKLSFLTTQGNGATPDGAPTAVAPSAAPAAAATLAPAEPPAAATMPRPAAPIPSAARMPKCDINVTESPFFSSCTLLQDVCVDQGTVVLYDPKHRPELLPGPPVDLPELRPDPRMARSQYQYRGGGKHIKAPLPPIHARPATRQEPRRYLANPAFSSCTVPVVWYGHNQFNFAHAFRDNAARVYSVLQETPWAEHARVVMVTAEGLAVSEMVQLLWQPLSRLRLTSWADFAARLPDGQDPSSTAGPQAQDLQAPQREVLPPSFEGPDHRCFRHMYVCTNDTAPAAWRLHEYGQLLVHRYRGELLAQSMAAQQPPGALLRTVLPGGQARLPPPPPVSILRQLGREPGKAAVPEEGPLLRVVFQRRHSEGRQLLNAAELLDACNAWRYTSPSGVAVRPICWEVELPTLAASIAAAQQADIFVGAHGANLATGWLMRPGSSVVELTMFEFDEYFTESHLAFAERNIKDLDSGIMYWKLLLCDPVGSWKPGRKEAAGTGKDWPKFRDMIVRWDALRTALEAVVDTGGQMQRYRQRYAEGRWWWLTAANQAVYGGHPGEQQRELTCRRARAEGLIHF